MSLYNMIHGRNPAADIILATLGLTREDVGRFRDAFVTDKDEIAIYTRNGGGNRDDYESVFQTMSEHPCYLRDEDDDFDSTYATLYFKFPPECAESLKRLSTGTFDPSAKWQESLAKIQAGDPTLMSKFKPLMEQLGAALDGSGNPVILVKDQDPGDGVA